MILKLILFVLVSLAYCENDSISQDVSYYNGRLIVDEIKDTMIITPNNLFGTYDTTYSYRYSRIEYDSITGEEYDRVYFYPDGEQKSEKTKNSYCEYDKYGGVNYCADYFDNGTVKYQNTKTYEKWYYESGRLKKYIVYQPKRLYDEEMWYYLRYGNGPRLKDRVSIKWYFENGNEKASIDLKLFKKSRDFFWKGKTKVYYTNISGRKFKWGFKMDVKFKKSPNSKVEHDSYHSYYYETLIEKEIDDSFATGYDFAENSDSYHYEE